MSIYDIPDVLKPTQTPGRKLLRRHEPYHFQRQRHTLSEYPRAAQPNTNQPNQKPRIEASSQREYWDKVYKNYLEKRT